MSDTLNPPFSRLEKFKDLVGVAFDNLRHVPGRVLDLKVRLILIRGTIPGTDETIIMLYAGRGRNLAYLKNKLLKDAKVVQSEIAPVFSCRRRVAALEEEADVAFVDIGLPYQGPFLKSGDYLEMPDWVSMIIPLEGTWEEIESRFNKTTRKLIRRNTYRYEVSHDPQVIAEFYDAFYLPYVTLRHEDAALDTRKAVEARAKQGGILRVIGEDGPVVAGVIYPEDGVLYYLWLGMAKDHIGIQPEGALFASYYFCLRYAHENGFKAADWQGTRALPTDGVFQFKRKWGAMAQDAFSPDAILFRPKPNNRKAIAFAERFPVIARRGDGLEQIFCTTAQTLTDTDIRRLISGYSCGGINRITIVRVSDAAETPPVRQSGLDPVVRVVTSNATQLANLYARDFPTDW